ncbi:MAG: thioredoxin family protein [Ginsengibacter sp.]
MKCRNPVIILIFCFYAGTNGSAQTKIPVANAVVKEAMTKVVKEHKNVFVIFHASWCSWCHKMERFLKNKE